MDFSLSEEQTAVFEMARDFGAAQIAPFARQWEAAGTIPRTLWAEVAALGLGGLYVNEASGGSGLSRLDATLVFEALAMACPSVAAFLSIHNMCVGMVDRYGAPDLKLRLLPGACAMDRVFSYCLTEPGSGSDAASLRTRAEQSGDGWRLTGTKAFISGGGYSDAYIVMARSGGDGPRGISAFVVEAGAPGLSFGGLEDKMNWRAAHTGGAVGRCLGSSLGRGRARVYLCDGRARRRQTEHCRNRAWRSTGRLCGDADLYDGTPRFWSEAGPVSGPAVPAGRNGSAVALRAHLLAPGGVETGWRCSRCHEILRNGQTARDRRSL